MKDSNRNIPSNPKLRALDVNWVRQDGKAYVLLKDPSGLSQDGLMVPEPIAPLLGLCDGTRDLAALQKAFSVVSGVEIPLPQMREIVSQLDSVLLLEGGRYLQVATEKIREFRGAPYRELTHAGSAYPEEPQRAAAMLQKFCDKVDGQSTLWTHNATAHVKASEDPLSISSGPSVRAGFPLGVLSPHIDYHRGGDVYARVWKRAAPLLKDVEVAIVLGTDHYGSPGRLTLTRQSYATPWGVLPTDTQIVDSLAEAIGPEEAFAEELHHIKEHSVELASVWLRYMLGPESQCRLVPVLCGSFAHLTNPEFKLEASDAVEKAMPVLKHVVRERRTVVIAAGDLAHVGPNFGDALPVDLAGKGDLGARDSASLEAIAAGDAEGFLRLSQEEKDRRRVCGLPPIYLMLRLMEGARGQVLGYAQCPADAENASFVSIAGALLGT